MHAHEDDSIRFEFDMTILMGSREQCSTRSSAGDDLLVSLPTIIERPDRCEWKAIAASADGSELFVIDQFAVGAVPQRSEDALVDRLLEEPGRAIAEQEIRSPSVPAPKPADKE